MHQIPKGPLTWVLNKCRGCGLKEKQKLEWGLPLAACCWLAGVSCSPDKQWLFSCGLEEDEAEQGCGGTAPAPLMLQFHNWAVKFTTNRCQNRLGKRLFMEGDNIYEDAASLIDLILMYLLKNLNLEVIYSPLHEHIDTSPAPQKKKKIQFYLCSKCTLLNC